MLFKTMVKLPPVSFGFLPFQNCELDKTKKQKKSKTTIQNKWTTDKTSKSVRAALGSGIITKADETSNRKMTECDPKYKGEDKKH